MMKRFLIRISFIIVPVFIFLGVLENNLRKHDSSSAKVKSDYIKNNSKNIEGLIFGSSTLEQGVNPAYLKMNIATLALSGNDINGGVTLFNAVKTQLNLKFIIFELSNGYLNKKNGEGSLRSYKAPYYFNTPKKEIKDFFIARYPLKKQLKKKKKKAAKYNKWGFNTATRIADFEKYKYNDSIIINSAQMHGIINNYKTINASNYNSNINLLHEMIEDCKRRNIKVVFVSPPKYYLCNDALIDEHTNRRKEFLDEVVDVKNVYFLNYERVYEKETKLFSDLIHLNLEGSQLFSSKLNRDIEKIILTDLIFY